MKAYLALHNVYGVDLNATAVELAEISLWLDTMVAGLSAPWFGLHLRRGNSLIGARRAVYRRSQVTDKSWLGAVPRRGAADLAGRGHRRRAASPPTGIHHFLLPADGWGAAADAKEAAALAPDAAKALKAWRGSVKAKPTQAAGRRAVELAHRVEALWQIAYRRLTSPSRRSAARSRCGRPASCRSAARCSASRSRPRSPTRGAYQRLRRVMDAWTALWFWPLTDAVDHRRTAQRSSRRRSTQWIAGLQALLGRSPELRKRKPPRPDRAERRDRAGTSSARPRSWNSSFAGAKPIDDVLREHPWLVVCERVAEQQGFFHWDLDFARVRPRRLRPPGRQPALGAAHVDVEALLAEGDPWWQLAVKPTQAAEGGQT